MFEELSKEDIEQLSDLVGFCLTCDRNENSKRLVESIRVRLIDIPCWASFCPIVFFSDDILIKGLEYFKSGGYDYKFFGVGSDRELSVCKPQDIEFTKHMALTASSIEEEKLIKGIIERSNYWLFSTINKDYFNTVYETDSFGDAISTFYHVMDNPEIDVEFDEYEQDFIVGFIQKKQQNVRVVYLLSDTINQKIGITNDIKGRIASIQNGNPLHVSVVAHYKPRIPARNLEKALHQHFNEHRLKGEWFSTNLSAEEFREVCEAYDKIG